MYGENLGGGRGRARGQSPGTQRKRRPTTALTTSSTVITVSSLRFRPEQTPASDPLRAASTPASSSSPSIAPLPLQSPTHSAGVGVVVGVAVTTRVGVGVGSGPTKAPRR